MGGWCWCVEDRVGGGLMLVCRGQGRWGGGLVLVCRGQGRWGVGAGV